MLKMQSEPRKKVVVILQSETSGNDNKYVNTLTEEGIEVKNISTLSFMFTNLEKLKNCLEKPSDYSGIIFTSTRAVSAVANALNSSPSTIEYWKNKLCFSVGESTSKAVVSLLNLKTYGSDSGNSANLCEAIIQKCTNTDRPLLFPCSSIRKDTIPDTLFNHNIQLEEIICYETMPNAQFKELWENLIAREVLPEILVFFSPSGVKYCFETIMNSYSHDIEPKFIALGPSTEKALIEYNVRTCKVAKKPDPKSVLCAVKELLSL